MLILTPEHQTQLQSLNETGDPNRRLEPITLPDSRIALNADLLSDCAENQTWAHYRTLLQSLPIHEVQT